MNDKMTNPDLGSNAALPSRAKHKRGRRPAPAPPALVPDASGVCEFVLGDVRNTWTNLLTNTRPVKFSCEEGDVTGKNSWAELKFAIVSALYSVRREKLRSLLNLDPLTLKSAEEGAKIEFSATGADLRQPKQIAPDFYVETYSNVARTLMKLSKTVEYCGFDPRRATISFTRKLEDSSDAWELVTRSFAENPNVLGATPCELEFYGEKIPCRSWASACVNLTARLYRDHSTELRKWINRNFFTGALVPEGVVGDFYDDASASRDVFHRKKIADGFYVESRCNVEQLWEKVQRVLAICGLDLARVRVSYYQKSSRASSNLETVSFATSPNLSGAKPCELAFGSEIMSGCWSWAIVYERLVRRLCVDYEPELRALIGLNLLDPESSARLSPDFCASPCGSNVANRWKELGPDFYLDTRGYVATLWRKMRTLLKICAVDPATVRVVFSRKG